MMTKRRNEGSSLSFAFDGWFDPSFSTIPVTVIVFRLYVCLRCFFFWLEAFRRSLSSLECGLIIDVVLANRRLAVDYRLLYESTQSPFCWLTEGLRSNAHTESRIERKWSKILNRNMCVSSHLYTVAR